MRLVEKTVMRPMHCAVFPHLGGVHRDGYFDTGTELPDYDSHVYVSVVAVREMARMLGWVPPEEQKELDGALEAKDREIAGLREENEALNREFEAIDVLASKGFQARKKPGRPKVKEAV